MKSQRSLSLAIGGLLAIGTLSAKALTVDGIELGPVAGSFVWTSNTAAHQSYAQPGGAASCGTDPGGTPSFAPNSNILFF